MSEPKKIKIQVKLSGESATIFESEQKKLQESQAVTLRSILKRFKEMSLVYGKA
jgi:hypothetical protein